MLRILSRALGSGPARTDPCAEVAAAAAAALAVHGAPGIASDEEARAIAAALAVHLSRRTPARAPRAEVATWATAGRLQHMNGRLSRQERAR